MLRRLRPAWILPALALVPACHDDEDHEPVVFLSDGFNRAAPGADWTVAAGAGTVAIDPNRGHPSPGLLVAASQGASIAAAQTTASFAGRSLTLSTELDVAGPGQGAGGVAVVDVSGAVLASAERPFGDGPLAFQIGGTSQALLSPGGGFMQMSFRVDAAGTASWSVNGAIVATAQGFPASAVILRLFHRIDAPVVGASPGAVVFDNVVATTP